jgi:glyoxylase-like metal-dependent hydrolase (beta-lactamase superfamily II)
MSGTPSASGSDAIAASELQDLLEHHRPVTVLDIRPADQRNEWHIPGSVHLDIYDALKAGDDRGLAGIVVPEGEIVVTVCAAGGLSQDAAERLRARGLDARSLTGGMQGWSTAWNRAELPLPVSDTAVVEVRRTGKGCLSYLIGSNGVAAVIDPSLDAGVYLGLAQHYGWLITHVLETHIHADHLMRSRQLASRTGARLHIPAQERAQYPFSPMRDGDVIDVENATLRVITTPGHTPESVSLLLDGEALFTGDTLFLNGVGRPDLDASDAEAREHAHLLYRSLQSLLALPPETIVLPGHTGEPVAFNHEPLRATIGEIHDRLSLLHASEEDFVTELLGRIPPTPPNYQQILELNEAGAYNEADAPRLEAGANRCAIA